MTNKLYFLLAWIVTLIASCSAPKSYPATSTPVIESKVTPSIVPTPTLLPLLAPISPTTIPYPTASVVKSNAVAFIAENSLWIANIDGSGERKLTEIEDNAFWGSSYLLQWSPDGKWISFISGDDLWIISPDGSINKKILSGQNTDKKVIRQYAWSPDGTEIAYTLAPNGGDFEEFKTGLLDLTTGKDSEILVYESPADFTLSWSPDGHHILVNTRNSIKVFDVSAGKITKEIKSACPIWHGSPVWSPNSKWFYRADYGTGTYYIWVCMNGVNGESWQAIDGVISGPVWDETGDFLYFITRKGDINKTLNLNVEEQLMQYDVRTKKTENLLSLTIKHTPYSFMHSISISHDRLTLLLRSQYSETQQSYILIDLKSLTIIKNFTLELGCVWSYDNKNFICLSQSNGYTTFYKLNIQTNEAVVFSGEHSIEHWVSSPIAITP